MSPAVIKGLIGTGFLSMGGVGIWQTIELFTPRNIRQRLELDGESFYSFDEGQDKEGWTKLAKAYRSESNGNKFDGLTLNNDTPTDDDIKQLQTKCREISDKKLDGNHNSDMEKVKKWCTIKGTESTVVEAA